MDAAPDIDLTKVEFPTDGMTIKDMRRLWPEAVDTSRTVDLFSNPTGGRGGEQMFAMLTMERDLARATYGLEFGRDPDIPYVDNDVSLLAEDLSELYVRFKIADGPNSATQLIRGIQSQAVAQARQHTPPRP